jgi:hypothetical protein
MRPILCVIDLSKSAADVVEVASSIASECSAHLIVLFAYRLIGHETSADIPRMKRDLDAEAKAKFDELEGSVLSLHPGLSFEFNAEVGFISDRVNFHIRKNKVGMIVMSPSPGGHFQDYGTLHQFIEQYHIPVVLVPEHVDVEFMDK